VYKAENGSLPATFTIDDLEGYATTWDVIRFCPAVGHAPLYYDAPSQSVACPNHVFP